MTMISSITPTLLKNHVQHQGELFVQMKRQVSPSVSMQLREIIDDEMPLQHSVFFSNLGYFVVATVDQWQRPWTSILVGPESNSIVKIRNANSMDISANLPCGDPFLSCFNSSENSGSIRFFAGLGIDFSNRRRNKVSGLVQSSSIQENLLQMNVETNESLGNCPKYITIRNLTYLERNSTLENNSPHSSLLTPEEKNQIHQASTLFMATRHFSQETDSDLGVNHRGGNPGFCRVYDDEDGHSYIVIPDYSGNRFYQSLGNVQSDRVAGLVIPNFLNGDLLYVTGEAENLYDKQADDIMPRMSLITRIRVTGHVFIKQGLNLEQHGPDQYSPYNPHVRLLRSEEMGQLSRYENDESSKSQLVSIEKVTPLISKFTFKLNKNVNFLPGSYALFDFSELIEKRYQHMNNLKPEYLNDDLMRTWTISSSPTFDIKSKSFLPTNTISCTIKLVEKGTITPFLHSRIPNESQVTIRMAGVGGHFTCFSNNPTRGVVETPNMIWISAGVGITPFLSMWSGLKQTKENVKISILFSGRREEVHLIDHFRNDDRVANIDVFDSTRNETSHNDDNYSIWNRRLTANDIERALHLFTTNNSTETIPIVYLCGPPQFMSSVSMWLEQLNFPDDRIITESFEF